MLKMGKRSRRASRCASSPGLHAKCANCSSDNRDSHAWSTSIDFEDTLYLSVADYSLASSPSSLEVNEPDMDRSEPRIDRLPTLYEVLARKTKPPVDLFSFYIYMRDQQRSVDYLDFWSVWIRCCSLHIRRPLLILGVQA